MKLIEKNMEQDFTAWQLQGEHMRTLFSETVLGNKSYQRRRIEGLRDIEAKYHDVKSSDGQLLLRAIHAQRTILENRLYRSNSSRLLFRLFSFLKLKVSIGKFRKLAIEESGRFISAATRVGAGDKSEEVQRQVADGAKIVKIPKVHQVSETERADITYQFQQNETGGISTLYTVSRFVDGRSAGTRSFVLPDKMSISENAAYHLVSGRAIEMRDGRWLQLDKLDRDINGSCKVIVYPPSFNFNLIDAVKQLPLKNIQDESYIARLIRDLRKGERVNAVLVEQGKEYSIPLEANPAGRCIRRINDEQRVVKAARVIRLDRSKRKSIKP